MGNTNIKSDIVVPWHTEDDLKKEAALQNQPAADQIAAAEQEFENQLQSWPPARRVWEWKIFEKAREHVRNVTWSHLATPNQVAAAT